MGKNKKIKIGITIGIIIILIVFIACIMLKYEIEGETNMPFQLSKIIVVGTAQGKETEKVENSWIFNLEQNNDIYISISKNQNGKKEEIIKSIIIENFKTTKSPEKGKIAYYKPVLQDNKLQYNKNEENKIQDKLIYLASTKTDVANLKIANQGGTIRFCVSNEDIEQYQANGTSEIIHDGTLFSKTSTTIEQLQFEISFDIIIELESEKTYKGNIKIELPTGNLIEEGKVSFEKTEFNDVIFKRI